MVEYSKGEANRRAAARAVEQAQATRAPKTAARLMRWPLDALFCCKLSADRFHLFASCGNPLPAVRRRVNQLFEVGGKLWPIGSSDFAQQQLEFREDANVLAL